MPIDRKRILIVTTELSMGGAERCVANLACRLDPQRFEVQVVALAPPPEPPKDALVHQLADAEIPLTFLDCRSKWQLLSATGRLKQIIRRFQPDVVWSFLFHANIVSYLATRNMRLVRLQSLRVVEQGHWRRKLQSWAARGADCVLCVSEGVKAFAEQSLRLPAQKLVVIPNGIDLDVIIPTSYAEPIDRPFRILAVGRLHEQKGFDWLIFRLAELLREKPEWELVILGEHGEGKVLAELLTQVESEELEDSVSLPGWQANLPEWFNQAEIFALSSRWEGMPNALIEAMAHGLPVMATDVEGVAELLPGKLARQVVTHDETEQAEQLLRKLMDDAELRRTLGQANRQQIETQFSLRQIVHLYESLLNRLLDTSRPER
ncbi:glycosyltransferase [Bremerella cremea]|uniref:glycosyltransferase n=1 Tax=Bremerella cremea TaxID=1031537 RepID=UPI0031EC5395